MAILSPQEMKEIDARFWATIDYENRLHKKQVKSDRKKAAGKKD